YAATELPEMEEGEGVLTMTEVEDIIPAHTGVVLCAETAGDYNFTQASTNGTVVNGNMLVGYAGPAEFKQVNLEEGSTSYVLVANDAVAGFYRKDEGFKLYNHKAYLKVPGSAAANALRINFGGDNGTTSINGTLTNDASKSAIYDITGRRVQKAAKGIYIVNGKKVIF
ncbi:MAG: hypothetical protein J6R91_06140, partial [Bacteroidaceae bacterium]|nr:hypothetical protein [Bacteroidaceae bacterium]